MPGLCDEVNSASPISLVGFEFESKLGINNGEYFPTGMFNLTGSFLPSLE